jgi:hypothetical protein
MLRCPPLSNEHELYIVFCGPAVKVVEAVQTIRDTQARNDEAISLEQELITIEYDHGQMAK